MEAGDDENQITLFLKEYAVRKYPQSGATHVSQDIGELSGILGNASGLMLKLVDKAFAEAVAFAFIPVARLDNFEVCGIEEPDFAHYGWRAASLALN